MNVPSQSTANTPPIEVVHTSDQANSEEPVEPEATLAPEELVSNEEDSELPEPIIPPGTAIDVEHLTPPDWTPPLYVKHRIPTITAAVVTAIWVSLMGYQFFGGFSAEQISSFLPHELGIILAGLFGPVVLLWVAVGYFERGKVFEEESKAIRWHLKQLTFPSESASSQANRVIDALRNQAKDLTKASEEV